MSARSIKKKFSRGTDAQKAGSGIERYSGEEPPSYSEEPARDGAGAYGPGAGYLVAPRQVGTSTLNVGTRTRSSDGYGYGYGGGRGQMMAPPQSSGYESRMQNQQAMPPQSQWPAADHPMQMQQHQQHQQQQMQQQHQQQQQQIQQQQQQQQQQQSGSIYGSMRAMTPSYRECGHPKPDPTTCNRCGSAKDEFVGRRLCGSCNAVTNYENETPTMCGTMKHPTGRPPARVLNREFLGKCGWKVLHHCARHLRDPEMRQYLLDFFLEAYPCEPCRVNLVSNTEKFDWKLIASGTVEEFDRFLHHVHNLVNQDTNKRQVSWEEYDRYMGEAQFDCVEFNKCCWALIDTCACNWNVELRPNLWLNMMDLIECVRQCHQCPEDQMRYASARDTLYEHRTEMSVSFMMDWAYKHDMFYVVSDTEYYPWNLDEFSDYWTFY
jgi:hypothetical protein